MGANAKKRFCKYPGCTNQVGPRKHFCSKCLPLHKRDWRQEDYERHKSSDREDRTRRREHARRQEQKQLEKLGMERNTRITAYSLQRLPPEQFVVVANRIIKGETKLIL